MMNKTVKIDPKDYPFKHILEKYKDDDTDEKRHLIKPVVFCLADCCGHEHEFCDPDDLDDHGKYKRNPYIVEAERCGFANPMEMHVARKKEEEDKKQKEIDELKKLVSEQNKLLEMMMGKLAKTSRQ